MEKETLNLFKHFDIMSFSKKYLKSQIINQYYNEYLKTHNKRTRSDCKILCSNMILFVLLWVLNPEDGYLAVLNKARCFLIKVTKDISEIISAITDAGLCKARRRFPSEILRKLWQVEVIGTFAKEKGIKLWKEFRVCAVDGTTFTLNKSKNILKSFPLLHKAKLPKMVVCLLYDVCSKIPLDIEFGNYKCGERNLLYKMIDRIKVKTLLLLDRGYPAYWLLHKLLISSINFVIRIPMTFKYKKIKKIGHNDWLIEIILSSYARSLCKKYLTIEEYECLTKKLTLRLIKAEMKGFRPRFIITSLIDDEMYPYNEICKLYCDRWIIENYYRDLKHILKVEKFHAQYVDGIYQEIYASMILTIILQKYIIKASAIYGIPFEEISFKRTFQILSNFIYLLELVPVSRKTIEDLMLYLIAINKQKKRPGRHYKRVFYRKIKCQESKSR